MTSLNSVELELELCRGKGMCIPLRKLVLSSSCCPVRCLIIFIYWNISACGCTSFISTLFPDGNITQRAIGIKSNAVSTPAFIFATRHSITIAAWVASSTTRRTSCSFWFCESAILNTESIPWFLAIAREYALETFSQPLWNQVIKRKQMYKYPLTCTNPYFNVLYFFFLIFWEWYFCLLFISDLHSRVSYFAF